MAIVTFRDNTYPDATTYCPKCKKVVKAWTISGLIPKYLNLQCAECNHQWRLNLNMGY